jgi:hypothetical protein
MSLHTLHFHALNHVKKLPPLHSHVLNSVEGFAIPAEVPTESQACFCIPSIGLSQIALQRYNIQNAVFE